MPNPILHLVIIVGSTRDGRFGPTIGNWFAAQARRNALTVDVVDLADARLPDVLSSKPSTAVQALGLRLNAADAFAVVTPEYNHSFPASLKNALDWYSAEWKVKPVGFVSYGGVSGGLRAVEQLRLVFAELHAVCVRDTVSFQGAARQFGPDGEPIDPARASRAAQGMLHQIRWWAEALREARHREPYPT